jgi:hypothetical protein
MPVAATVYLSESNGAGQVITDDISNCNFGGVDLVNIVPANHPIVRNNTVPNPVYSFRKYWRVKVASMGDSLLIQDIKMWKTSGAYIAGEQISRSDKNETVVYATPTQVLINAAYTEVAISTSDPVTANMKISNSLSGTIIAAPAYSDYVLFQMRINFPILTPIGAVNQKTFIFSYDES